MEFVKLGIACDIFRDAATNIRDAEVKVKKAKDFEEKQYYAQEILLRAKDLLSCQDYDSGKLDCTTCHSIFDRYIQQYENLAKSKKR